MAQQQLGRGQPRAASMIAAVRISENLFQEHEGERRDEKASEAASRLRLVARTAAAALLATTTATPTTAHDATVVEGTAVAALLATTTAAPVQATDVTIVEGLTFFSWTRRGSHHHPGGRLSHTDAE